MELKELLSEIDSLKAEIDKLRPLKLEVEHRIMQKFRLDWNYHSNAIEGNSLTLGETRAFLLEGLTANGKPLKDHLDIKGHDELISFLQQYIQRKETLTEADIREMHKILLKESYEVDAITPDGRIVKKKVELGRYKTEPNCVRMKSGEIHNYVHPQDVPARMAKLIEAHREQEKKGEFHPLLRAALFHYGIVEIHPFDDGNGRMARILMNLILMRAGFPPVVIKLQDREPYIAALRRADGGETQGIVQFVGQNLIDSENLYLRGSRGESISEPDDVDKEIQLLKQELARVEEPLELSPTRLEDLLRGFVSDLVIRVAEKLTQFDDLFYRERVSIMRQIYLNEQFNSSTGGNSFEGSKRDIGRLLSDASKNLLRELTVYFSWEGFRKAGHHDFNTGVQIQFNFELRKYSIDCRNTNFRRQLMYQERLFEDDVKKLASDMARFCLAQIDQNRKATK